MEHGGRALRPLPVPPRRRRSAPCGAAGSRRRRLRGRQPQRAAEPSASAVRLQLEPGVAGPVDVGVVSNGRFPARLGGGCRGWREWGASPRSGSGGGGGSASAPGRRARPVRARAGCCRPARPAGGLVRERPRTVRAAAGAGPGRKRPAGSRRGRPLLAVPYSSSALSLQTLAHLTGDDLIKVASLRVRILWGHRAPQGPEVKAAAFQSAWQRCCRAQLPAGEQRQALQLALRTLTGFRAG